MLISVLHCLRNSLLSTVVMDLFHWDIHVGHLPVQSHQKILSLDYCMNIWSVGQWCLFTVSIELCLCLFSSNGCWRQYSSSNQRCHLQISEEHTPIWSHVPSASNEPVWMKLYLVIISQFFRLHYLFVAFAGTCVKLMHADNGYIWLQFSRIIDCIAVRLLDRFFFYCLQHYKVSRKENSKNCFYSDPIR